MIERLILPNLAMPLESLINTVSRLAFDGVHDLGNGIGTVRIGKRRQYQMNMVRHDHGDFKNAFSFVSVDAGFQGQISGRIWQVPAKMGGEGYEKRSVVLLNMRQVPAGIVVAAEHG
jgi:hypothetical protein